MDCPTCGGKNRDEATFCDSCGTRLRGEPEEDRRLRDPPLYGLMKLDWLVRFAAMAVVATAMFILFVAWGTYDYALLFLILGAMGWVATYLLLPRRKTHLR